MRKQKGFLLIEPLMVLAIILIIAAVAIPNLLCSRIAGSEASTVTSLRIIAAEVKRLVHSSVPAEPNAIRLSEVACLSHLRVAPILRHTFKLATSPEIR
jgi:prepilin-type N-terminal cleavage/methylation domain-containing protein